MGRPKKKSDYDSKIEVQKQMNEVVAYFGMNYDDRNPISDKSVSLRDVADHFGITLLKARRILVTAGVYSTEISRRVQELYQTEKSEQEIMEITGLSRASVNSMDPVNGLIVGGSAVPAQVPALAKGHKGSGSAAWRTVRSLPLSLMTQ